MPNLNQRNSQEKASKNVCSNMVSIGALGPEYTFTDNAAQWLIDKYEINCCSKKLFNDIEDVFDAVKQKKVSIGIVPVENSIHGSVRESLDSLFKTEASIILKYFYPIHHVIACKKKTLKKSIKKVYSHIQALSQCGKYLKNKYNNSEKHPYSSTVAAIKALISSRKKDIAVICSKEAAERYGLKILDQNIEDKKGNKTAFLVIENNHNHYRICKAKSKEFNTSIAFYFGKDKPGTLFGVFEDFKKNKVNMTKIESRPTTKRYGEYIFFLEFEGDINSPKIKTLLDSIDKKTAVLKNFGTYKVL